MQNFDNIWENILSEDKNRVELAFKNLNESERTYVLTHLQKMSSEEGWHPGQTASARFALNILAIGNNQEK